MRSHALSQAGGGGEVRRAEEHKAHDEEEPGRVTLRVKGG